MLSEGEVSGLIIIFAILSPFLFVSSLYSLRYHAARYKATPQSVEAFIKRLWLPIRFFYMGEVQKMYYNDSQYTPEQIANSLQIQRVMACIIPILFLLVDAFRIAYDVLRGNTPVFSYIIVLIVLTFCLFFGWRFGHQFKDLQASG